MIILRLLNGGAPIEAVGVAARADIAGEERLRNIVRVFRSDVAQKLDRAQVRLAQGLLASEHVV